MGHRASAVWGASNRLFVAGSWTLSQVSIGDLSSRVLVEAFGG